MAFLPVYHERNMKNIAQLGDKTKAVVLKVYAEAIKAEINILIYSTIRTLAEQKKNVASGASQTMKSYHLVGQALDVVLCNGEDDDWKGYSKPDFKKFIAIAKKHGLTWGGDWDNDGSSRDETFVDSPHFQYGKIGYGKDTFKTKGVAVLPKPVVAKPAPKPPVVKPKPVPKPVVKPKPPVFKVGEVTADIWSQRNAFFLNTGRVKVLKKGERYKVYDEKNGYYSVGGSEWVNKKFMKLV